MSALLVGPLPQGLIALGILLALRNAATTFRRSVNTPAFLSFVRKKAEAGQHDRLWKLVAHMPMPELLALTRRWLELELDPVVHAVAQGGYRQPAEVVPLAERTRAALAPYVEQRRSRLRALLPWSVFALCLAAAGVALGPTRDWVPALASVAGVLSLYGGVGVWRMRRDLLAALDVLVTLPRPEPAEDGDDVELRPTPSRVPRRLVVRGPGREERDVPLEASVVKIGSLPSAEIRIEGEGVSRLHAVLEVLDGEVLIIDLGSASGTWVDGERIDKHVLMPGDRVTIGDHELEALG